MDGFERGVRISELQGRSDFPDLMEQGLNPLLLEGASEEPSRYSEIFTRFPLVRNSVPFPSFKGLVVGKITEGEEIPFINLGTGKVTVTAEDYGVRCGFTHQMIRDDEVDVMRYTTLELGRAHTRLKDKVAFAALETGAANSQASSTSGKLVLADIRAGKKVGATLKEDGTGIPRPAHFTHIIMHPNQEDDLLPADLNSVPPGIVLDPNTGDIKGVAGLKAIKTVWVTDGVSLLVKAKDKMLYCVREELRLDKTERFSTAAEEVRTMEAFTFAILDGNNIYKITDC